MKYNLIVFGTRPELIKLIPVILSIRERKLDNRFKILCTSQHLELISDLLDSFNITPDITLSPNKKGNSIVNNLSSIMKELQVHIESKKVCLKYIIAQGDTTSALAASMVAFLNNIHFAHIEAGLRTYDHKHPFPEEYFRQVISLSTNIHFTPTNRATQNLLNERIPSNKIIQTGNTIVDLIDIIDDLQFNKKAESLKEIIKTKNNVIITCHRRENQNSNFDSLIQSVKELAHLYPDLNFIWLSHLNPFVELKTSDNGLKSISNITVIDPISIFDMIDLYRASILIITDSGGIQEEAISFNVPTIVVREKTERTEAVEIGNSIVVGSSPEKLKASFEKLIERKEINVKNPFGEGNAASQILDFFETLDYRT